MSARTGDAASAAWVGREVEALYTNGPAGGGGARSDAHEVVAVRSATVPRSAVRTDVHVLEV